jgi:hypothetical protein
VMSFFLAIWRQDTMSGSQYSCDWKFRLVFVWFFVWSLLGWCVMALHWWEPACAELLPQDLRWW